MAETISIHINTDPTHTPEREETGFPSGSVTLTFYPDDDAFGPGTAGLDILHSFGGISVELDESIAGKYDGWYFITDDVVDELPNKLRDTIIEFKTQAVISNRVTNLVRALVEYLPSSQQAETVNQVGRMCRSIVLGQQVSAELPVWNRDEPIGWIIHDPKNPYVTSPLYAKQSLAHDACEHYAGVRSLNVLAVSTYEPQEEIEGLKPTVTDGTVCPSCGNAFEAVPAFDCDFPERHNP